MPETNPFLPDSPDVLIIENYSLSDLLALRSVDFAELPFSVRIDQLIEALPFMNTGDLLTSLGESSMREAFLPDGGRDAARRYPRARIMVAAALCHVHAELNRRLVVQMNVLDRDTGDPQTLRVFWRLPPALPTLEHAIDWIYACVRESWAHELNEALHVGGIRRRDLHNERGGAMPPPPDTIDPWWDER